MQAPSRHRFVAAVLTALAAALLSVSCTHNRREGIALPYAKKKCPETLFTDHSGSAADSATQALRQSLANFLWLQDSNYVEERERWVQDEYEASCAYLKTLRKGMGGEHAAGASRRAWKPVPSLVWRDGNLEIDSVVERQHRPFPDGKLSHRMLSVVTPDTVKVHLYFIPRRFGSGRRPLVLVPYDTLMHRYAVPPSDFFEKGGVLAVLGHCRSEYKIDPADSVSVADSLPVLRYDYPVLSRIQILSALNELLAQGYTSPCRTALIAAGINGTAAERLFFERPELFGAAYLAPSSETLALQQLWAKFPPLKTLTPFGENPYPALLLEPEPSHYALLAFLQELNGRLCGSRPALMYPASEDYVSLWRFLKYHI